MNNHAEQRTHSWWRPALTLLIAVLLLGLAFNLRTLHIDDWDDDAYLHPDERYLVYATYNLRVPETWSDYFTTTCPKPMPAPASVATEQHRIDEPSVKSGCSTLNPRNFNWSSGHVYGSLPLSLTRWVAEQRGMTDPEEITLIGRSISAWAEMLTLMLVALIALRLGGRRAALIALALGSVTAMMIQQAHFYTVDALAAMFGMITLYGALRLADARSWKTGLLWALLVGLGIGCAAATKINMISLVLPTSLGALAWGWQRAGRDSTRMLLYAAGPLLLAGFVSFWTYRIANPDAFAGPGLFDIRPDGRFLKAIGSVADLVSGEADYPPSHQWADRPALLFPLWNMVIWGMGLALGVTAWLSWAGALWRSVRTRHLVLGIIVAWVGIYFLWQGSQFVKSMRYLLPIYGPLIALSGWGLSELLHLGARRGGWARGLTLLATAGVLVTTLLWGWGFSRIYAEPNTRVAAAAWVRANIPQSALLTKEYWDDALPGLNQYQWLETHPYAEDEPKKIRELTITLAQADYVLLTSNRVYDSISRLPTRFPATMRYYDELFKCADEEGCSLGFELVADFSAYPSFFGMPLSDQRRAEEAFSVYDHPRVLIFKKTPAYDPERAYQLFTQGVAWGEVYRMKPIESDEAPTALRLTPEQWEEQHEAGTWASIFDIENSAMALLLWLLLTYALGAATLGILLGLRLPLPDRGLSLALPLGLVLPAYIAWLLTSVGLLSFSRMSLVVIAALWIGGGLLALSRRREEALALWRDQRPAVIGSQALYALGFLLLLWLRWRNPDLWHEARGGEKPMELAFLNATIKASSFPPYDPWYAGGFINYYYWGFVIFAAPLKLLGIVPEVGFNLALATVAGWTLSGAWGAAWALLAPLGRAVGRLSRRAAVAGVLAAVCVALLGNLAQPVFLANKLRILASPELAQYEQQGLWLDGEPGSALSQLSAGVSTFLEKRTLGGQVEWPYWNATRVLPGGVNEFPYFSFLYGDLHAHVIALPLALMALTLLAGVLRGVGPARPLAICAGLLALMLGVLRATNSWDYPTFLALALVGAAVGGWRYGGWRWAVALASLVLVGGTLAGGVWDATFASGYSKVIRVGAEERLTLRELLALHGLWLFVLASYAVYLARQKLEQVGIVLVAGFTLYLFLIIGLDASTVDRPANGELPFLEVAMLTLGKTGFTGVAFVFPLLLLLAWQTLNALSGALPRRRIVPLGLGLAGALLLVVIEFVALDGAGRMNTVFKFGYQIWALWAMAAALMLPELWAAGRRSLMMTIWRAPLVLLLAGSLLYPLTATGPRLNDRFAEDLPHTLNGAAFMRSDLTTTENGGTITLSDDWAAIRWLRENIAGTPIIAEAHLPSYRWGSRIATWTGLPTILGWETHERQQRQAAQSNPAIDARNVALRDLYTIPETPRIREIMGDYGIELIYVGALERAVYGGDGNAALFDRLVEDGVLRRIYEADEVRIYRATVLTAPLALFDPVEVNAPADSVVSTLTLPVPLDELKPVLTEYADAKWLSNTQPLAVVLWLLLWLALGLLGLPLAALAFRRRGDLGWAWGRLIALLVWGWLIWAPVNLGMLHFSRLALLIGALGLIALDLLALWLLGRSAADGPQAAIAAGMTLLRGELRARRRAVLVGETVFLALFGLWLWFRSLNPDVWHPYWGGEKPFEFALLNSLLRAPVLPPPDAFFSGGIVNYYYYGIYLMSLPVKALGLDPGLAFNLIIPTIAGLAGSAAYGVTLALTSRARWGVLGALALTTLGNLGALVPLGQSSGLKGIMRWLNGQGSLAEQVWFWGPSRVIYEHGVVETINEFPYWSLLYGDLHPHLIALPITVLMIGLCWELLIARSWRAALSALLLTPLVLGGLAVTNSWDTPTYAALLGLTLLLRQLLIWRSRRPTLPVGAGQLLLAGGIAVAALAAGVLLYLPFFGHYRPVVVGGVGLVDAERHGSPLGYLLIYGPWLLLLAFWMTIVMTLPRPRRIRRLGTGASFMLLLAGLAIAVLVGTEIVYIRDHLDGGPAERMNTVFKFGYQAWTLLALAAAVAVAKMAGVLRSLPRQARLVSVPVVGGMIGLVLLVTLTFTIAGPISRLPVRFHPEQAPTLDGLAFMDGAQYSVNDRPIDLTDDGAAIAWMKENLHGTPVVLQSQREFYRTYGVRIAANTGLPTVLGALHANEQRPGEVVAERDRAVEQIYSSIDAAETLQLLGRYRVSYVYVGAVEQALYPEASLMKFEQLPELALVQTWGAAKLYQVDPAVWERANQLGAVTEQEPSSQQGARARVRDLERAYAADPSDISLGYSLAQAYVEAGQLDKASALLRELASLEPQNIPLRHMLGDVLSASGDQPGAEAAYREAITIEPSAGNISKLGQAQLGWGELESAAETFDQAVEADPEFPFTYYFLGELEMQHGNQAAARARFEYFLSLAEPGAPYTDLATWRLESLQ